MTTRPCDSCARWYDIGLLTAHSDAYDDGLMLCPACYEWRTGIEAQRRGNP